MFSEEKERRYFSWVQVWQSEDREKAQELELAFYKCKINARIEEVGGLWTLEVPWIHKELAETLLAAYSEGLFDYPHEIPVGEKWKSYDRYQAHKFRGRGSKVFLILGFVFMLLMTVRLLYGLGLFQ